MTCWDDKRCARLGYLLGLGWNAERIAADSVVAAPVDEVRRQVARLSLNFRAIVPETPLNLSAARMAFFDAAARARRLPTEALLRKVCEGIADARRDDLFPEARLA